VRGKCEESARKVGGKWEWESRGSLRAFHGSDLFAATTEGRASQEPLFAILRVREGRRAKEVGGTLPAERLIRSLYFAEEVLKKSRYAPD
jgi:hypothetical protein